MTTLSIGNVSEKFNIPISTLRYYDKKGLLPFATRNTNNERTFSSDDLGYLDTINCLKIIGLPINTIKTFIDLCMVGDETLADRLTYIQEQEQNTLAQIQLLKEQLAYIHWKEQYYQDALVAGTERVVKHRKFNS